VSEGTAGLSVEVATWLVGADGLEAVDRCEAELAGDADVLAAVAARRREGLDRPRAAAVVDAALARSRARGRWPDADRLLFTREALEQASDPAVSAWRARRFTDATAVEDRAAGCGADTLALAATGARVTALDLDAGRLTLLRHNARVRGYDVTTVVADALAHPAPAGGPVHADPARRVAGRRVRRLAEHRPSVPALLGHLGTVVAGAGVAVVLGPGLDLEDPDLPAPAELEFVQVGRQLVEAVAWTGALATAGVEATATLLAHPLADTDAADPLTRSRGGRAPRLPVGDVGDVLVEVAPAAVRARLHDELGAEIGARRIADRRALLTSDGPVAPSPWWRTRTVEAVLPARPRTIRRWLRTADPLPVELVLHGVTGDPTALRRELGDPPGGPDGRRVELIRRDHDAIAVVTRAHPSGS
jgi:hypothetical protein